MRILVAFIAAPLLLFGGIAGCDRRPAPAPPTKLAARAQLARGMIADESRFVLPPEQRRLTLDVPAGARLSLGFGLAPAAWKAGVEAVEFVVTAETDGRTMTLHRQRLERPAPDASDGWTDAIVALDAVAGRRVVLALDAHAVAGRAPTPRQTLWTMPRLVMSPRPGGPPNIILISIDTLRPDHLGCYGYERDTSPTIDRLAREGVLFRNVISSSSWTLPAHATMFTGVDPSRHGAVRYDVVTPLPSELPTLPELLWDRGLDTAGFTAGIFVSHLLGFARGFDAFHHSAHADEGLWGPFRPIVDRGIDWMRRRSSAPFFLFLHTYEVHLPYAPPPPYDRMFDPDYDGPYRERFTVEDHEALTADDRLDPRTVEHLRALYDGEIRHMDAAVGTLLESLRQEGLADNTCVFLTSDHGEEFMEHGHLLHQAATLYEELVRVPLIAWCPRHFAGGRVIEEAVGMADIMPTLLDLAGAPPPDTLDGQSLLAVLAGTATPAARPLGSQCDGSVTNRSGRTAAVRDEEQKLITSTVPGQPARLLFDLGGDPGERTDLAQRRPEDVRRLDALIPAAPATPAADAAPTPDAATRERMRALGYLH